VVDYRMFPLKRSEDQSVTTEVSSRPSQTQVAGSGVEQVTGADDHSDTATYAADCGPETDETLDTSQLQKLETKQDKLRETHGLGLEIRDMMQGMGREMQQVIGREMSDMRQNMGREMREMQEGMGLKISDMRGDIGREMREMRKEMGREMSEMQKEMGREMSEMQKEMGREMSEMRKEMGREMSEMQKEMGREMSEMQKEMGREMSEMQKEMGREMSEMQKEMSEVQQKFHDIFPTVSRAGTGTLAYVLGRSTEEDLKDVTTHLTGTGTIVF